MLAIPFLARGDAAFKLFDATAYTGKDEANAALAQSLSIIYPQELWGRSSQAVLPSAEAVEAAVRKRVGKYHWIVFDIESWPLEGDSLTIAESIRKFKAVLSVARQVAPRARIGIYGEIPRTDYAASTSDPKSNLFIAWQRRNNSLKELIGEVDALFPSLYTQFDRPVEWARHATQEVREARRIGEGKPVYPFIWPEYHPSSKLFGHEIDGEYWATQLSTLCLTADGAVIWGGWDLKINKARAWNPEMPWWKATLTFLGTGLAACSGSGASK
jgi:hypothetical protein